MSPAVLCVLAFTFSAKLKHTIHCRSPDNVPEYMAWCVTLLVECVIAKSNANVYLLVCVRACVRACVRV